jgi:hypothetical protein
MSSTIDILEQRVAAAVALIASLREEAAQLERQLATTPVAAAAAAKPAAPAGDSRLGAELERLRAERVLVRDRVRGLLREIDRVSW